MTNPGGMRAPNRGEDMAPLHPRLHLNPQDDPRRVRDLQVWPRSLCETHNCQELRRTAPVKHPLRSMAGRDEMLTTYEHDFGVMVRANPKGRSTGFGASFYGTGGSRPPQREGASSCPVSPSRISCPRPWDSTSDDDARSIRSRSDCSRRSRSVGELGATLRDPGATLGHSTLSKMDSMVAGGSPMRLNVNGWGDTRWSPKSHPHMILGLTAKRCGLEQTARIMNLRAPDVPFVTR